VWKGSLEELHCPAAIGFCCFLHLRQKKKMIVMVMNKEMMTMMMKNTTLLFHYLKYRYCKMYSLLELYLFYTSYGKGTSLTKHGDFNAMGIF
jgi:hypothetical protein